MEVIMPDQYMRDDGENRRERRAREHREMEEFKSELTEEERADLDGPGTRSFAGEKLLWAAPDGTVHAVEAAEVVPDIMLAWTLCSIDVPAGGELLEDAEAATCPKCLAAEKRPREPWVPGAFKPKKVTAPAHPTERIPMSWHRPEHQ
jgi:hypothetical protein